MRHNGMNVMFSNNGKIMMDNVIIKYPNFSGIKKMYNDEGDRNFVVVIDDPEIAEDLRERGFNIRIKTPEGPGEMPEYQFKVNVSYRFSAPIAYLKTGRKLTELTEDTIGTLDSVEMERVDLDIRLGKEWTANGRTARTAYLDKIVVVQEVDRFLARYAEEEHPEEY